jgi:hypothetical protein
VIALDGNAIAGDLIEALGIDLAAATCVCASCGTSGFFAEAVVSRADRATSRAAVPVVSCSRFS